MEEQIAKRDQWQVTNLVKLCKQQSHNYPRLLESVTDPFITELLPNIEQYVNFAETKELQIRAAPMAQSIISQLRDFLTRVPASGNGEEESKDAEEVYKRYKKMSDQEKVTTLVTRQVLNQIEQDYQKMTDDGQVSPQLFEPVLDRIMRVMDHNFVSEFSALKG